MELFGFVGKYFWAICIAVAGLNYLLMDRFAGDDGGQGDRSARRRYLGWLWGLSCVPWIVAGYGQIAGGLPNVWTLFRPQDRNPYVWAFYVAVLFVYLVFAYWVFFRDGARIAAELRLMKFQTPGRSGALSEFWIKVIAAALLPFFALWLWMTSLMNVPLPP